MKIFLDDDPIRDSWVDDTWTIVRDPAEVLYLIETATPGHIEVLSLDHDLGLLDSRARDITGYWLLQRMEEKTALDSNYIAKLPKKFRIHSANPVGRKNMQAAIDSIERMRG